MTPRRLARAAEQLIGTPFRLHGRDPATGLDCIGLFAAAMAAAGRPVAVPTGYTFRVGQLAIWLPELASCGLRVARGRFAPGDVVLLQPGPAQVHLAIADRKLGWIHAHAGLRKVVRDRTLPQGQILHHWRLLRSSQVTDPGACQKDIDHGHPDSIDCRLDLWWPDRGPDRSLDRAAD